MKKKIFQKIGVAAAVPFVLGACSSSEEPQEIIKPASDSSVIEAKKYTKKQNYNVGENAFFIEVEATMKNGKIEAMEVIGDPNGQTSLKFAEEFKNSFESKVEGKTLEEAKNRVYVSGASATTDAFHNALDAIAEDINK